MPRKAITEASVIRIKIERYGCKYPSQTLREYRPKQNTGARAAPVSFCFCGKTRRSAGIALEEIQKAPSTMALTKTNATQAASILSFVVMSTRRASTAVKLIAILPLSNP
jgi:hypothetical protein